MATKIPRKIIIKENEENEDIEEFDAVNNNDNNPEINIENNEEIQNNTEEETETETETKNQKNIELQLGDIIKITNPVNDLLNEQIFFIDYIDNSKTYLVNTETFDKIKLNIKNGIIGDGNITSISILSRANTPSYSRQNNLFPKTWINIFFGGDYPVIITGEITNLEEDMIEIKTVDNDTLYINFDYKGLPEELPINKIEIRDKPSTIQNIDLQKEKEKEDNYPEYEEQKDYKKDNKEDYKKDNEEENFENDNNPLINIKGQIQEFIIRADQIKFVDEELGPITQYVDVSTKFQKYSIETQMNDLLDDLLSTIPTTKRTTKILNNIHTIVERYKELWEKFSLFDKYGIVISEITKEADNKPLLNYFNNFNKMLYWIFPVVKNEKRTDLDSNKNEISTLINNYKSNNLQNENNKYRDFYSKLNSYLTPFEYIDEEKKKSILIEKEVFVNLEAILDNDDDMYSTVYISEKDVSDGKKRFYIQRYNVSNTILENINNSNNKSETIILPIVKNDILSISSIIMLPEPIIRFSKINLPNTNILEKTNLNLHFLNYWKLLNKKSLVHNYFIDSLDTDIELDNNSFNNINNFVLNIGEEEKNKYEKNIIYDKFINKIIPKTKKIFNLMKKYIHNKFCLVDVLSYLEPFLIYTEDLTYQQYKIITHFIYEEISNYNKSLIEKSKLFQLLSNIKSNVLSKNVYSVLNIISDENGIKENNEYKKTGTNSIKLQILDAYDLNLDKINGSQYKNSNTELLLKILQKDNGKLYTTSISLLNSNLIIPNNFTSLFEEDKKKLLREEENINNTTENCKTIIIAKYYSSKESLEYDNNNNIIYFDKKYDKTNYGLLSNYEKEIIQMDVITLKNFITKDLMNKQKLTEKDASYLAETLIDGHKKVIDGNYAILYKGFHQKYEDETEYYIRKNNKWVLDDELIKKEHIVSDESSILCNLKEKCISDYDKIEENKCTLLEKANIAVQTELLKEIISEFDNKYYESIKNINDKITEKFKYLEKITPILLKMDMGQILKYSNEKFNLGMKLLEDNSGEMERNTNTLSPFSRLLNLILSQTDFIKKQNDIVKFVNLYTRPSLSGFTPFGKEENNYWLYCIQTNQPILPLFKSELAKAYITSVEQYLDKIEKLKKEIGKISDDGDSWIDKNSGWIICKIDFDTEEGFEEGGFKRKTRELIEEDVGNKITLNLPTNNDSTNTVINTTNATNITKKFYRTPEVIMINNIVTTLSVAMGINIENQKEFIINAVLDSIKNTVENEANYNFKREEQAKSGKSIPTYKIYFNTSFLFYTLGMYLIAIQTSIPNIKTRKTHPGCIRSFSGYPFEGNGDMSSLIYLSCIVKDEISTGEPWNVLKGKKNVIDLIQKYIKNAIDKQLLELPEVKIKIDEKLNYLLTNNEVDIPQEYDLIKWIQFLPPSFPFKIKNLTNITEEFKNTLKNDLKSGSKEQMNKLLIIFSKTILYSFAIQEKIQETVKKQKLLLTNINNEPYLENSCCISTENKSTIDYFIKQEPVIKDYNLIVINLSNLIEDIANLSKAKLFCSIINTKINYPAISNNFDNKTIYLAFIVFCKFNNLIPVPKDLLPICIDKPQIGLINTSDNIEYNVQKLKDSGKNYTNDQFLRLLQLVNRNNIINVNISLNENTNISNFVKISNYIDEVLSQQTEKVLQNDFLMNFMGVLEEQNEKSNRNTKQKINIEYFTDETKKETKDLNNYLNKEIEKMKTEIINFIKTNSNLTPKKFKNISEIMNKLSEWKMNNTSRKVLISDYKTYNIIQFYKTYINNFVNIFPTIILNNVDYSNTDIPKYYRFSENHKKKLKNYISVYNAELKKKYGSEIIKNILERIQTELVNVIKFAEFTPCITSLYLNEIIDDENKLYGLINERTGLFLYEYYILLILFRYITLIDEKNIIIREKKTTENLIDISTTEFDDEIETRDNLSININQDIQTTLFTGNKMELKQQIAELIIIYLNMLNEEKNLIDINYEDIQDRTFKLREREKDLITDRLKTMTDEERNADTMLKVTKQGLYEIGMKKGLTVYDKEYYEDEQNLRDEMTKIERKIRGSNKDATDDNIDILIDEYMEQNQTTKIINEDAYDMENLGEDFYDGIDYEEGAFEGNDYYD